MISPTAALQELLDRLVLERRELGLQLVVYQHGQRVADLCAGVADRRTGQPVTPATLFPVFSVTKAITATLIHRLVARGDLSYDTPVASVWPEFGAQGKSAITVGHVLSHRAGVPNLPVGLSHREVCDWDTICAAMADLTPIAPPGSLPEYHPVTYGWILGEAVRRVDGKSYPDRLRKEVLVPLQLAHLHVGVPPSALPTIAHLEEQFAPGQEPAPPDDPTPMGVPGWMQPLSAFMNRPDAQRACMPGVSGVMNAGDLAKFYAAHLPGGIDGVELLPRAAVLRATAETGALAPAAEGELPRRLGLGYFLGGAGCTPTLGPRLSAFGHGGYGGSQGYADPEVGLAVGLTKNLFLPTGAHAEILGAVRRLFAGDA